MLAHERYHGDRGKAVGDTFGYVQQAESQKAAVGAIQQVLCAQIAFIVVSNRLCRGSTIAGFFLGLPDFEMLPDAGRIAGQVFLFFDHVLPPQNLAAMAGTGQTENLQGLPLL